MYPLHWLECHESETRLGLREDSVTISGSSSLHFSDCNRFQRLQIGKIGGFDPLDKILL